VFTVDTVSNPDAAVLSLDLTAGEWSVLLLEGWRLERDNGDGTYTTVDASLVSPNPQTVTIATGVTVALDFRFETSGEPVVIGDGGRLDIGIDVDEVTPPGLATFRISSMQLRDPHVFFQVTFFGCQDITDSSPWGFSINDGLASEVSGLSMNTLLQLDPLDVTEGATGAASIVPADCWSSSECMGDPPEDTVATTYAASESTPCVAPAPGTTDWPVAPTGVPCVGTEPADVNLPFAEGTILPLRAARVGGRTSTEGTLMDAGLLLGFLSQADAETIWFDTGTFGSASMAQLLPGGPGCASLDGRDVHDGEIGWWLHFEVEATPAELLAP
jgi:hypothetical protein